MGLGTEHDDAPTSRCMTQRGAVKLEVTTGVLMDGGYEVVGRIE